MNSADPTPICPCGQAATPQVISNPPGLATIAYRVGDYASFREALLRSRPGETALTQAGWRPGAAGDLAVQIVEWWAYLADILTFYNERAANRAYLRTADLPESVNRLIRLLGYRPRPGIGATGTLAGLAANANAFTLPKGLPFQSKPGPGSQPQVFELSGDVTITPPPGPPGSEDVQGVASLVPVPPVTAPPSGTANVSVRVAGTTSLVKAGDRVLILPVTPGTATDFALATAAVVTHEKDAAGNPVTTFTLTPIINLLAGNDVSQYHLMRSAQSAPVWQYPADDNLVMRPKQPSGTLVVDLASIVRGIAPNDLVLIDGLDKGVWPPFGTLQGAAEVVWFANPQKYDPSTGSVSGINPALPPPPPPPPPQNPPPNTPGPVPIAIPHTSLTLNWSAPQTITDNTTTRAKCLVRYGWKDVGRLAPDAVPTVGARSRSAGAAPGPVTLQRPGGAGFLYPPGTHALVEDVNGNGAWGAIDRPAKTGDTPTLTVKNPPPLVPLVPPLRAMFNLLPVTRGKTVASEVLGSGNAQVPGQDFVLRNAPVTYLQSGDSRSGDGYSSTVHVRVSGVEWLEVPGFYNRKAGDQVFVTREDEQGRTHVVFGDGENGARLPTGVNNVIASYRYGSGAAVPPAGALTAVLQPRPGLRAVRNPVPVGGGADPDPPAKVRRLAPRSLLALGRAVSVDDYEAIAAQAPGVVRARAIYGLDSVSHRPLMTVCVGDDAGAVAAAQAALAAASDPNRPLAVTLATPIAMTLTVTIVPDPRRDAPTVLQAVRQALLDSDTGLLGVNVVAIGQAVYDTQIYAACLAVSGVVAVTSLDFHPLGGTSDGPRHDPGKGRYLVLDPANLTVTNGGGP